MVAFSVFFPFFKKNNIKIPVVPSVCILLFDGSSVLRQALVHDIYSELVEDACLGLCFEVHRAVKQGYFFLDETDQESMKEFGEFRRRHLYSALFSFLWLTVLLFYPVSRDRGPAGGGHIRPSVQSVEKQRVRVSELQKTDCGVSLRPPPGEMPGHGAQQQPHRQPQVCQGASVRSGCCSDPKQI